MRTTMTRSESTGRWLRQVVQSTLDEAVTPPPQLVKNAFEVARTAGLVSIVDSSFRARGMPLPDEFEEARGTAIERVLIARAAIARLQSALDAASVRWLLFKGPALAAVIYGDEFQRDYADLDVLVHPFDLDLALDALIGAGAQLIDNNWELIRKRRQGEISILLQGMPIDLHWHFHSNVDIRRELDVDIAGVLANRVLVDVGGLRFPTLDPYDTVIFIASHALLSGGHRLRWCLDFHLAFAKAPEVDLLWERARHHNARLQLVVMADRCAAALAVPRHTRLSAVARLSPYRWLCRLVNRIAPPECEFDGRISGRVIFASARAGDVQSLAKMTSGSITLAARRGLPQDGPGKAELHRSAGGPNDRDAWVSDAGRWMEGLER